MYYFTTFRHFDWASVFVSDAVQTEQQDLVLQKLRQCQVVFDFLDPVIQLKSKEVKRAALNELIDHITTTKGSLTEPVYPEVIRMVISFRSAA